MFSILHYIVIYFAQNFDCNICIQNYGLLNNKINKKKSRKVES